MYECDNCGKKFEEPKTYPDQVSRPEEIEYYTCPFCGSDCFTDLEEIEITE